MTLDERIRQLSAVAEFSGLAPDACATLAAAMREETFKNNQTIVEAGDVADRILVLCEGEVEVSQPDIPGRLGRLSHGALIGEIAFLAAGARTATLRAKTDCALLSLPYPNFRDYLLMHPESALVLARGVVRKLLAAEHELATARKARGDR